MGNRAARFAEDRNGAAMVEFAFMFPILVMILMMTITTAHVMMIDRKVSTTALAAADLFAQRQAVDVDSVREVQRAAELMLRPFAAEFDISVSHVPFELPGGAPNMGDDAAWVALINTGAGGIPDNEAEAAAAGTSISAPTSTDPDKVTRPLGDPGDALLMLRMNYQYRSMWGGDFTLFGLTFPGTMTFRKDTFARPRLNRQIVSESGPVITVN